MPVAAMHVSRNTGRDGQAHTSTVVEYGLSQSSHAREVPGRDDQKEPT